MALETMTYTTAGNTTVNLMSAPLRSEPRNSKLFQYLTTDGVASTQQKEFSLYIIATKNTSVSPNKTAKQVANETIKTLMSDISDDNYGVLTVNGWKLKCRFTGLQSIEDEHNGVLSFTMGVYAPDGRWYSEGTEQEGGPSTSVTLTLARSAKLKAEVCQASGSLDDAVVLTLTGADNTYTITVNGEWESYSEWAVVNGLTKTVTIDSEDAIDRIPDSCNPFPTIAADTYTVTIDGRGFKVTPYILSDMPEW